MKLNINLNYFLLAIVLIIIGTLTIAGKTQQVIVFNSVGSEIAFTSLLFGMAAMLFMASFEKK